MIPEGSTMGDGPALIYQQPSRTWKLDFKGKKISGTVDGIESIKQAIYKILNTQRFKYLIYSMDYGHELNLLIGEQPAFIQVEVKRYLQEALKQDSRIKEISSVYTDIVGDNILVQFTAVTNEGNIAYEWEVNMNG